jgi:hypothetical protein
MTEVVEQILQREQNRIPAKLRDVHQFVKNKFDRMYARRVDWAMIGAQVYPAPQGQARQVSVSRNPPKR